MKLAYFSLIAVLPAVVGSAPVRAEEGEVLFHDDFATLDREWGDENDRMRNEDHKLVLLPAADRGYSALLRHPFGDADIRATFSQAEGDPAKSAGIVFWGGRYDDYYVAMLSTNGMFAVFRWENERWSNPVGRRNSDAIKQGLGQTNELRVVTQGNLATFYVNGRQVAAIRGFPPEVNSRIGLHAESGNLPSRWEFSDFKVLKAPPATPPARTDGNVLFADDFATLDPAWGSAGDQLRVEGGKLILQPAVNGTKFALYQGSVFGDADIRVTVATSNGKPYVTSGLFFWATDLSNCYVAVVRADGVFGCSRLVNGKPADVVLWKENEAVKKEAGQANHFRVVTRGDSATCYVNDKQVAKFTGSPPAGGGRIGLYSEADDQPCQFEFSGLQVLKPPATSTEPGVGDPAALFSDDFAVLDPNWGDGDRFRVSNNKLIMQPPVDGTRLALYEARVVGEVDIRATVSQIEGEAAQPAGIVFWGEPDGDAYYLAQISPDGTFVVYRRTSGRWLNLTTRRTSDAIKRGNGQTNELRVVTQGRSAAFYVNGREVAAIKGYPPELGRRFGLYAESGTTASTWEFSAFKVMNAPAGEPDSAGSDRDVIFAEDFATLDPAWSLAGDFARVENHKLIIQPVKERIYVDLYQGNLFHDADIRVKVAPSQGDLDKPAAISFWGADNSNFYVALIKNNGQFAVFRQMNGRWLAVCSWQKSDAIEQGLGQVNELRVVTLEDTAVFYVNGRQVTTVHGFPPEVGHLVGVYAESGESSNIWEFTEFKVLKAAADGAVPSGPRDGGVIFADDFATRDPAWSLAGDVARVENHKLVLQPAKERSYVDIYQGNLFGDVDVRVKTSQAQETSGQAAGIVFWGGDLNSYYVADVHSDGEFAIRRRAGERWLLPLGWRKSDAIKQGTGQVNELRVVTQGNLATFYINGKQAAAIRGYPPGSGGLVGLLATSGEVPTITEFSDFQVLKPPVGGPAATGGNEGGLLLADDFSTLDPAWGPSDETVNVDGHKLILTPKLKTNLTVLHEGSLFDDADVRATLAQSQGEADHPAGIVFWGVDNFNAYAFGVQSDGTFGVFRRLKGKWLSTVAWQPSEAVNKGVGKTNDLRVVTKGNAATVYINDKEVASFRGFPPSGGGQVGFWVVAGDKERNRWESSSFSVRKAP